MNLAPGMTLYNNGASFKLLQDNGESWFGVFTPRKGQPYETYIAYRVLDSDWEACDAA